MQSERNWAVLLTFWLQEVLLPANSYSCWQKEPAVYARNVLSSAGAVWWSLVTEASDLLLQSLQLSADPPHDPGQCPTCPLVVPSLILHWVHQSSFPLECYVPHDQSHFSLLPGLTFPLLALLFLLHLPTPLLEPFLDLPPPVFSSYLLSLSQSQTSSFPFSTVSVHF